MRREPKIVREWQAEEERLATHLELLELSAFVPAAFPLFFHALDGDETHVRVLWPRTDDRLHGRHGRIGG